MGEGGNLPPHFLWGEMMKRRILALCLAVFAFLFFCCGPLAQEAQAIAIVDDAVLAVIIALLAAAGLTYVVQGEFESTRKLLYEQLGDFAATQNKTVNGLFSGSNIGISSNGKLLVNNRFLVVVSTFAAWLKSQFAISDNQVVTMQQAESQVNGLTMYKLPMRATHSLTGAGPKKVENIIVGGDAYFIVCYWSSGSSQYFRYVVVSSAPVGVAYTWTTYNNAAMTSVADSGTYTYITSKNAVDEGRLQISSPAVYMAVIYSNDDPTGAFSHFIKYQNIDDWSVINPVTYTPEQVAIALSAQGSINDAEQVDLYAGEITLPLDNPNYQDGYGGVIDVGAPWGSTLDEVTDVWIPGEFSEGQVGEADVEYESAEEIEDEVDEELSDPISNDPSDYAITGLETVFPFCIPFDIYNFFEALDAPPQAPSFDWRFYVPGICDETITIDLSVFDSVAALLRTMELLGFCVGLAFITRKIIRG